MFLWGHSACASYRCPPLYRNHQGNRLLRVPGGVHAAICECASLKSMAGEPWKLACTKLQTRPRAFYRCSSSHVLSRWLLTVVAGELRNNKPNQSWTTGTWTGRTCSCEWYSLCRLEGQAAERRTEVCPSRCASQRPTSVLFVHCV